MSRIVRVLGRTKAYFMECKQSMAPMPNPDWYEEKKDTLVNFENLRKLPLSVHVEVWKTSWEWYRSSFELSFAWGRRRREDAKKQEAQEKMDMLQGMVKEAREATHNTPEDLDKTKQAIKELLHEIEENKDDLKSVAQEKLDLIRISLSAFSSGYREARDQEIKRVMAMDKSMLQNFLSERAGEVKHASSLISDAFLKDDARDANANPTTANASKGETTSAASAEAEAAAAAAGSHAGGNGEPDGEPDVGFSDPRALLSKRARGAVDDLLHDPDIERLAGRAAGFARGRLLQAEAAARVLKGEDEGGGGGRGNGVGGVGGVTQDSSGMGGEGRNDVGGGGDVRARESDGSGSGDGGGCSVGGESETPIISGLAKEAREFVAGKMGQVQDGAREVVEAAIDVRRSHRAAEEENVDRKEGGAAKSKGGVVDAEDGKERRGASDRTKVGGGEEGAGR